jgi:hypothetical protein
MNIWPINEKIEMEYKLFNRYDDPGTSNETDNFV